MGWCYRKSVNLGPFRINASKSGLGYSLGGGGFRTGVNAKGRRYSRVTIPGTGMSYTTSGKKAGGMGCLVVLAITLGLLGALWLALY